MAYDSQPHVVVRVNEASKTVAYYQHMMERSRVDLSHLQDSIDRARAAGNTETVVARYATRAEAEKAAAAKTSGIPGITYWAGWDDSGW